MKTLEIKIPENFMNCGVSVDGYFYADTNDSANWDTIKFKLPEGNWIIQGYSDGGIVHLIRHDYLKEVYVLVGSDREDFAILGAFSSIAAANEAKKLTIWNSDIYPLELDVI